jgi:hypothetical protein
LEIGETVEDIEAQPQRRSTRIAADTRAVDSNSAANLNGEIFIFIF